MKQAIQTVLVIIIVSGLIIAVRSLYGIPTITQLNKSVEEQLNDTIKVEFDSSEKLIDPAKLKWIYDGDTVWVTGWNKEGEFNGVFVDKFGDSITLVVIPTTLVITNTSFY